LFRYCYVGSGDGHLEVFKNKEYGNLLERIKTDHPMGVDCVQQLRPGLLLTASNEDSQLRITNVSPNKNIGTIGVHTGGVQQLAITSDAKCLITVGWEDSNVKLCFAMEEERISCLACGSLSSLNICPRCCLAYCSVKCYRSEMHRACSESFYRECVEKELRARGCNEANNSTKTFEEFMSEQYGSGGAQMDSNGCLAEYQSADERDLDRQLTLLGVGLNDNNLVSALSGDELKSFTALYERLEAEASGLGKSVFKKKSSCSD
uniref:HIT-type domain-containing protein n=1 Tax=Gongylonema pulchrum TaxID=637853 RepID=A0A183CXG9_9BILA